MFSIFFQQYIILPWGDSRPEPVWLDDLFDDERVEDDNCQVGEKISQDQLTPDNVDWSVHLEMKSII